jgi:uroporphyrinogen-III synthase
MALKKNDKSAKAKKPLKEVKVAKSKKSVSKSAPVKAVAKLKLKALKKTVKTASKPSKVLVTNIKEKKSAGTATFSSSLVKKTTVKSATGRGKTPVAAPTWEYPDKNKKISKVRTILISQPKPAENEKSPYLDIARKYNVKINFRQFIQIDPVPAKEFRSQRINLMEYNAVILTSRVAIDHYFRMCNEMRYTVPETTKYFCLTESIAYYLQKYVQYRKRKIFYGQQSISELMDVIKKHREEKFLLPVSDVHREKIVELLDDLKLNYSKATFYRTVSANLSDFGGKLDYDVVLFFTPAGIQSLFKNFPNFKQGETRIGVFGTVACNEARAHNVRLDIAAPNPENPSMATALENYIKEANKR